MAVLQALRADSGAKKTSLKRAVLETTFAIQRIRLRLITGARDMDSGVKIFSLLGLGNQVVVVVPMYSCNFLFTSLTRAILFRL